MRKHRTKRQRHLTFAVILGGVFIIALISIFWIKSTKKETYIPGGEIPGLTSELARNLPKDYPKVHFADVTREAGITFTHYKGARTIQLPEDMGSGAAWGDYNNDGWMDLFVVNFSGPLTLNPEELETSSARSALYHNNGDGTFTDIAKTAGVDLAAWGNAAAWFDLDNDGWADLIVTAYGHNYLFKNNQGDGTFSDISEKSEIGKKEGYWAGIAPGDYNHDGFIDIYICGYVDYSKTDDGGVSMQYNTEVPASINPSSFPPIANLLYRNNGNGTFTDVTDKAGVANENGRSLSAAWCDFDEDSRLDLYVANDVSDNVLYRNLGNETFEEISHSAFVADYRGAMGIAIADWDLDLDMDMFITHWMAQENALYNNLLSQSRNLNTPTASQARFMDEADRFGLGQVALEYIGFGTAFFDYNNDGLKDLFITNGSTFQQSEDRTLLVPMPDKLFWNKGKKEGFFDVSAVSGEYFNKKFVGRGSANADFDNDGDLDIYIANNIGPGILLRNEGGNSNSWIEIKLSGTQSNSEGLGAKIKVATSSGYQMEQSGTQGSYFSQNSNILHFGLGKETLIDTLFILWPSEKEQIFTDLQVNQLLIIQEDSDEPKFVKGN